MADEKLGGRALVVLAGLTVTIEVENRDPWPLATAAVDAIRLHETFVAASESFKADTTTSDDQHKTAGPYEQMREIARRVCSDGRFHERSEIAQACRDAGMTVNNLDRALKRGFEKGEAVTGRRVYRDESTVAPDRVEVRDLPETPPAQYPEGASRVTEQNGPFKLSQWIADDPESPVNVNGNGHG